VVKNEQGNIVECFECSSVIFAVALVFWLVISVEVDGVGYNIKEKGII